MQSKGIRYSSAFSFVAKTVVLWLLFQTATYAALISYDDGTNPEVNFSISAIERNQTAPDYYGYNTGNSLSADIPDDLTIDSQLAIFLFQGSDGLSLFTTITDVDSSQTGNIQLAGSSSNLAGNGVSFLVKDDADDTFTWNDSNGSFSVMTSWSTCCNDGFVLGYLNGNDWSIDMSVVSSAGLTGITFYTFDDTNDVISVAESFSGVSGTITIAAENVPTPSVLAVLMLASALLLMKRRR